MLHESCVAYREQRTAVLPAPKPRKAVPQRETAMLLLLDGDEILLQKRPPSGIWGGLWSLPEIDVDADPLSLTHTRFGVEAELLPPLPVMRHAFTHFLLHITPRPLRVIRKAAMASEAGQVWLSVQDAMGAALPTPVRKLLRQL